MAIDWGATGSWMQAWAGFAGAGAVAYAAKLGANTYRTWLKQKQTERTLHAAEQVLTAVYKVRSSIEHVRARLMPAHELEAAERKLVEVYAEDFTALDRGRRQKLITSQAMLMRITRYNEVWDELPANMALAYAFLDPSVEVALKSLLHQIVVIQSAAETYGQYVEHEGDEEDKKFVIGLRRDLWGTPGDDEHDKVGAAMNKAVADVEAVVRPLLRSEAAGAVAMA